MAQDTQPTLLLSDIVHGITPSPTSKEVIPRSLSPEVLHEKEVAAMRKRVLELNPVADQREKELVDMVSSHLYLAHLKSLF
jgi:hypothetical protein